MSWYWCTLLLFLLIICSVVWFLMKSLTQKHDIKRLCQNIGLFFRNICSWGLVDVGVDGNIFERAGLNCHGHFNEKKNILFHSIKQHYNTKSSNYGTSKVHVASQETVCFSSSDFQLCLHSRHTGNSWIERSPILDLIIWTRRSLMLFIEDSLVLIK